MSRYLPYPRYKCSGVEWLGEVPDGWPVLRGKVVFFERREPSRSEHEQLAATQGHGVIPQSLFMEITGQKVVLALKGTAGFRAVKKNDFVISLRSFQGGIEHSSYLGCVSPAYTVLRAFKETYYGYYRYCLKSAPYIQALQGTSDSLRDGKAIKYEDFGKIPLPLPPLPEQRKIAAFLDHETGKIDVLIQKQERLIELLREKRQTVISHAVTKGLDPSVPMKDSSAEWLGEVPEHWGIWKLKYAGHFISGFSFKSTDFTDEGVPVLKITNIRTMSVDWTDSSFLPESFLHRYKGFAAKNGDLVFALTRPIISSGIKAAFVTGLEEVLVNQRNAIFRQGASLSRQYLYYVIFSSGFFASFDSRLDRTGQQPNISTYDIADIAFASPSPEGQKKIAAFLDHETGKIDTLISKAEQAIELLKERRAALISATVTGKIDVRDWETAQGGIAYG